MCCVLVTSLKWWFLLSSLSHCLLSLCPPATLHKSFLNTMFTHLLFPLMELFPSSFFLFPYSFLFFIYCAPTSNFNNLSCCIWLTSIFSFYSEFYMLYHLLIIIIIIIIITMHLCSMCLWLNVCACVEDWVTAVAVIVPIVFVIALIVVILIVICYRRRQRESDHAVGH